MKEELSIDIIGLVGACSYALDCIEAEFVNIKNKHGKRVAYISIRMAEYWKIQGDELQDLAMCALLHDNALTQYISEELKKDSVINCKKDLVRNAVYEMKRHVTANEVYEFIKEEYPTIGKGTVYRNLDILVEEGALRKVEVPDGPNRFDFTLKNHYHVRCIKCLFLSAFLFEMAAEHSYYAIPARVLAGLGAICFTLFSIVSILESGTSSK